MVSNLEELKDSLNIIEDGNATEEILVDVLKFTADKYYSGEEVISDSKYDSLVESLREINPNNPLIMGLAGDEFNSAGYKVVNNGLTMGTLRKCQDLDDFDNWWRLHHAKDEVFIASAKMDGSGMLCYYENGEYIRGSSRGDGYTGYDKTELFRLINFPKSLKYHGTPFTGYIRGEAEISNENFKKFFSDKKNPRNACAGLLNKKLSDMSDADKELVSKIDFITYDIRSDQMPDLSRYHRFRTLENWDFKVPQWIPTSSYEEIISFRNDLSSLRGTDKEIYAMDGMVLSRDKYDSDDQQKLIQDDAVAIKFDLMVAETTLKGIEWSNSGRYLTPVAILEPVYIGGVTVSRASLCNLRVINDELGVKIGDRVRVCRRGEVIPKVIGKVH